MTQLIDKGQALEELSMLYPDDEFLPEEFKKAIDDVWEAIWSIPPIDAVPVIRCKDCKHADWYYLDGIDKCYCKDNGHGGYTENDFCSHAEREETNE